MASKICHSVPLLLRAFDFTKQYLSFFQNSNLLKFTDHHGSAKAAHINSPSLIPSASFLLKNLSFSHLPSMASSGARFPSKSWQPYFFHDAHTRSPTTKAPTHISTSKDLSAIVSATDFSFLCDCERSPDSSVHDAPSLMPMRREREKDAEVCTPPRTSMTAAPPSGMVEEHDTAAATPMPASQPIPIPSLPPDMAERVSFLRAREETEDSKWWLEEECPSESWTLILIRFRGCHFRLVCRNIGGPTTYSGWAMSPASSSLLQSQA